MGDDAPSRNAPKSAWMPIHSVASADARSSTNTTAIAFADVRPGSSSMRRATRTSTGRSTKNMQAMKAAVSATVYSGPRHAPAPR